MQGAFSMVKKEQWAMIRQLRQQGMKISEIAKQLNMDRKTVRKMIFKQADVPKYRRESKIASLLEEYKPYIQQRLEKYNLTSEKLYQEVKNQGYSGKYGILNLFVRKEKAQLRTKAVLRFETLPGEQAQVDWGYFGQLYDQEKKKTIRLCCFFMVLGYSRMRFAYFFDSDDTYHFLMGHHLAFEYFGGYTREILYDNLKSVVIKRALQIKESEFNKLFIEFSGFYGFKPILARPYRPQTKGKVENSVKYVRNNFFEGESFASLAELNHKLSIWLNEINQKIHHTTHKRPIEMLNEEGLIAFHKAFDLTRIYYRQVGLDAHVHFDGNKYSVPHEFAKKEVSIKKKKDEIYIYYRNECIAQHKLHLISEGKFITHCVHKEKLAKERLKGFSLAKLKSKKKEKPDLHPIIQSQPQVVHLHSVVKLNDLSCYEEVI